MRLYCCGGAGGNIGKQVKNSAIDVCYVDTSISNLKGVDLESVYLVEGMDGAGKLRKNTYEGFEGCEEEVLIKFKPSEEVNIIVTSLSGGSGSIISPLLTSALLKENKNVIVIGIESHSSVIELTNTISSLKSFKAVSDLVERSVSLFFVDNTSRKEADSDILSFLNLIRLITDKGKTEEFDTSDLGNFLNFEKVTDNEHSVSLIDINLNTSTKTPKGTSVVSTILVTKDKNSSIVDNIPEYLATCVVTEKSYNNEDMRIDNLLGGLVMLVDKLDGKVKDLKDNKKINKFKDLEVDGSNKSGIVL